MLFLIEPLGVVLKQFDMPKYLLEKRKDKKAYFEGYKRKHAAAKVRKWTNSTITTFMLCLIDLAL